MYLAINLVSLRVLHKGQINTYFIKQKLFNVIKNFENVGILIISKITKMQTRVGLK